MSSRRFSAAVESSAGWQPSITARDVDLADRQIDAGHTTQAVMYGLMLGALAQGIVAGIGYWVFRVGAVTVIIAQSACDIYIEVLRQRGVTRLASAKFDAMTRHGRLIILPPLHAPYLYMTGSESGSARAEDVFSRVSL